MDTRTGFADAAERLIYLDDFCDESMPCAPALQSWADWLSKPDPTWGRDAPAAHGELFSASELIVLGDVRVEKIEGEWQAVEPPPAGTESFHLRWHEGSSGWDPEHSGDTIADALDCMWDDEAGPVWLACVKSGDDFCVRYIADGPRCEIVRAQ